MAINIKQALDPFRLTSPSGSMIKRVFAGIDSLTAGAPSYSYLTEPTGGLVSLLRAKYGDAGRSMAVSSYGSGSFYKDAAGTDFSAVGTLSSWQSGAKSRSLCGHGTTWAAASGSYFGIDGPTGWTRARIYFALTSSGSVLNFGQQNNANTAKINPQNAATANGWPQNTLLSLDCYADTSVSTSAKVTGDITGGVDVFWIEFYFGTPGVLIGQCGTASALLQYYAALDDAWQRQWYRMLKPDVYLINGGINDRGATQAADVQNRMATIVDRIMSNGKTIPLLIRCADPSDAGSTHVRFYDKYWSSMAMGLGCGFFDIRSIAGFGDYSTANAAGNMYDTVHPSAQGNRLIAAAVDGIMRLD